MRVPPFERYVRFLWGTGLFLAGAVVGAAFFMSIFQHNFSILKIANERLAKENQELKDDLNWQKKNINRQNVIGKIVVNAESEKEGAMVEQAIITEIEKRVAADLQVLKGQPLSAISSNPQIYQNLIDRKIYTGIHEKDYIVRMKTMMISPSQLTVWVTVQERRPN
jgi:hypothetical protein